LEVRIMLMIEGVEYGPCGYCHHWNPIEEMGWSYKLAVWVCAEHTFLLRPDR
jgi:hypothetical protein